MSKMRKSIKRIREHKSIDISAPFFMTGCLALLSPRRAPSIALCLPQ
jgi:hypothetical protein